MDIGYSANPQRKKKAAQLGIAALLALVLGNLLFTQMIASSFGYSDTLGSPFVGLFYFPWKGALWYFEAGSTYPQLFKKNFELALYVTLGLYLLFMIFLLAFNPVTRGNKTLYGTARWSKWEDIKKSKLLDPLINSKTKEVATNAVVVGGVEKKGSFTKKTHYLFHRGPEHILAFAPSRSGKGVSLMLPTLFTWLESAVILDIKGEAWGLSSGWAKNHTGVKVMKFDPTDNTGNGAKFNPLEEIRTHTNYDVSDAQNLTEIITDPNAMKEQDHWDKTSKNFLAGALLHLLYKHEAEGLPKPTLADYSNLLSDPEREDADSLFEEMIDNDYYRGNSHPLAASSARAMLNKPERERGSVLSTADTNLALYKDPILAANTSKSDFKITDLMNYATPVRLYLVLRPSDKERLMPLIRVMVAQLLNKLTREMAFDEGESVSPHKHRLLLMLDEFTSLAYLKLFEDRVAFLASYGIKCYIIVQDLKQLYRFYSQNETLTPNCHIRIAFAANEIRTAQYISQSTGETTVIKEQISASGSRMSAMLGRVTKHYSEVKRPLLTPDEVTRLPMPVKDADGKILKPGSMLIFSAGHPPILGTQPLYFMDDTFTARSKVPPPLASDNTQ